VALVGWRWANGHCHYSITSSARASSRGGTAMPSALAAYRNLLTAGGAVSKIVSLPVSKIVSLPCHADGISLMQNVLSLAVHAPTGTPAPETGVRCYNEALTIVNVVRDFRLCLPKADIYIYDNGSDRSTCARSRGHRPPRGAAGQRTMSFGGCLPMSRPTCTSWWTAMPPTMRRPLWK